MMPSGYLELLNIAVLVETMIVSIVATILVLHKDYEDGLFGRLALFLIVIASVGRGLKIIDGDFETYLSPVALLVWTGFAAFFVRHLSRFLNWKKTGEHSWREALAKCSMGKKK